MGSAAKPMSDSDKGRSEGPPSEMSRFLPCLSYSLHEVDPGMDASRDEGEARLLRLRPLLRMAVKTPGLENMLKPENPSALAQMLAPRPPNNDNDAWNAADVMEIHTSLLSAVAKHKPAVTLLTPTVRMLSAEETDALDECDLFSCVPIKRQYQIAIPESAPLRRQKPTLVVRWHRSFFCRLQGAKHGALMTVQLVGEGRVCFTIESAEGLRHDNLYACDIPNCILERVFEASHDAAIPPIARLLEGPRLPQSESDLPDMLQLQLAGFAQYRMRAHVLTAASGPRHTTRPLWFDNYRFVRKIPGKTKWCKRHSVQVKAYLHPCSATCFCGAHLLQSPELRWANTRFTGKQHAVMTVEMCGECLSDASGGGCPTHGSKCVKNAEFAPGFCCSNLSISFACVHENFGEWKGHGLYLPGGPLDALAHKELSMLLGMCAEYNIRAAPLFEVARNGDVLDRSALAQVVAENIAELNRRVQRYDVHALQHDARPSDADLARLDMVALACLREGGVTQVKLTRSQKVPKLKRHGRPELNNDEKKLAKTHHWMFPRHDQPFGRRVGDDGAESLTSVTSADPSEQPTSPSAELARPRFRDPNYDYEEMTEYIDDRGCREFQKQLSALMQSAALTPKQRRRGEYLQRFVNVCNQEYGSVIDGPLGLPARPLVCKYRQRNDGGRLYPNGMPKAPGWHKGEARSACIQGMTREMRPFMCGRWAHDYDMKNAQPEMLSQMPNRLSWADERSPPKLPELQRWCADRPEYIEHVAEVHRLPTDAERHPEYRKDCVKELMMCLIFGGQYRSWINRVCADFNRPVSSEPRSARVDALAAELAQLRKDVFESREWRDFAARDRARIVAAGKKKGDEIDRSVFARIAQKTENEVLTVMRAFLKENGWTVLTLCFDGLLVCHRPERTLDLAAMNARILQDTGYKIEIVEKPMFSTTFPTLTLDRA